MADRARAVPENVEGRFFVDSTCIDCDTCRQLAPGTFGDTGEFSFVEAQPRDRAETRSALHALVACPTGSIGTAD
jgi:ferredoxin